MTCSCESLACSSCSTSQVASSIGPEVAVGEMGEERKVERSSTAEVGDEEYAAGDVTMAA